MVALRTLSCASVVSGPRQGQPVISRRDKSASRGQGTSSVRTRTTCTREPRRPRKKPAALRAHADFSSFWEFRFRWRRCRTAHTQTSRRMDESAQCDCCRKRLMNHTSVFKLKKTVTASRCEEKETAKRKRGASLNQPQNVSLSMYRSSASTHESARNADDRGAKPNFLCR